MRDILVEVLIFVFVFCGWGSYCCCVAAGRADERTMK